MPLEPVNFRAESDDMDLVREASKHYYPNGDGSGNISAMLRNILHDWVLEKFYRPQETLFQIHDTEGHPRAIVVVQSRGTNVMGAEVREVKEIDGSVQKAG
jgi:hypothetical protein